MQTLRLCVTLRRHEMGHFQNARDYRRMAEIAPSTFARIILMEAVDNINADGFRSTLAPEHQQPKKDE